MAKIKIETINKLTEYWLKLSEQQAIKAMKAIEFLTFQRVRKNYVQTYKAGDFVWIEYGDNIPPEISFSHLGIIYKAQGHGYYVLPITTPKDNNRLHINAFHAVDNPTGNRFFVKIKKI